MQSQDERGKDMIFSVDSKPSMRAAAGGRPTGAFGQRYPINLAAKADSPAVANVSATSTSSQPMYTKPTSTCIPASGPVQRWEGQAPRRQRRSRRV